MINKIISLYEIISPLFIYFPVKYNQFVSNSL